jgi:hypothetical protein
MQNGKANDIDAVAANWSATRSEVKKATVTQPEKERLEGRTHKKEAPKAKAKGTTSPGTAVGMLIGEGKAR